MENAKTSNSIVNARFWKSEVRSCPERERGYRDCDERRVELSYTGFSQYSSLDERVEVTKINAERHSLNAEHHSSRKLISEINCMRHADPAKAISQSHYFNS